MDCCGSHNSGGGACECTDARVLGWWGLVTCKCVGRSHVEGDRAWRDTVVCPFDTNTENKRFYKFVNPISRHRRPPPKTFFSGNSFSLCLYARNHLSFCITQLIHSHIHTYPRIHKYTPAHADTHTHTLISCIPTHRAHCPPPTTDHAHYDTQYPISHAITIFPLFVTAVWRQFSVLVSGRPSCLNSRLPEGMLMKR